MKRETVYRSSITGKFVTPEYAAANPHTTIRQTIAPWRWIKRARAAAARHRHTDQ